MLIAVVPILVTVLGIVMWNSSRPKIADAGRILFAAGALVSLLVFAQHTIKLL